MVGLQETNAAFCALVSRYIHNKYLALRIAIAWRTTGKARGALSCFDEVVDRLDCPHSSPPSLRLSTSNIRGWHNDTTIDKLATSFKACEAKKLPYLICLNQHWCHD